MPMMYLVWSLSNIMEYCYSFDYVPSYIRLADAIEKIFLNNASFDWSCINTALFEKKRPSFLFKSIVFNILFPAAFCISVLKKKLKLSFGSKLNKKFDNYYMLHEKEKNDKKNDRSFLSISKKTAMIVNNLKDHKWGE